MVTTLSAGDRIHVGEFVTLTLLAIEGKVVRFGVESSESGGHVPVVLLDGTALADHKWWELN